MFDDFDTTPRKAAPRQKPRTSRKWVYGVVGVLCLIGLIGAAASNRPEQPQGKPQVAPAIAPISETTETPSDRPKAPQTTTQHPPKHREKTEHVSGYYTKSGKYVAPYVRRAAD